MQLSMSSATRIRRGLRALPTKMDSLRLLILLIRTACLLTLLSELLSNFDQIDTLRSALDLIDERLQVIRADHRSADMF